MNIYKVTTPTSPEDFAAYYQLRWAVLRQPWNQPLGSEKDDLEHSSTHAWIVQDGKPLAVGRLQVNTPTQGQIRYMATAADTQGIGLGTRIMQYLEVKAKALGLSEITLNARQGAVGFYQSLGYQIVGDGETLWGIIPHKVMHKKL